ncbi:MAG: hypothetical protein K6G20_08760, partial [Ruminococcus sp.]|nr:hypothetical protein [Ruminococcus sp.]
MIKKYPGAFIGEKSALKLKSFLDGFEYAMFLFNNESFTKNYAGFNKWFEIKHNIRNTDSWYEYLIRHYCMNKNMLPSLHMKAQHYKYCKNY